MGTPPMANRTKGQGGEAPEQKSRGSEGQWDRVREGCRVEYAGLCRSGSELAGNDAGFGVRSGGHADVIGWGHNTSMQCTRVNPGEDILISFTSPVSIQPNILQWTSYIQISGYLHQIPVACYIQGIYTIWYSVSYCNI